MLQAAMVGIAGVLLALQIKAVKPEFSVYLSIATSVSPLPEAAETRWWQC